MTSFWVLVCFGVIGLPTPPCAVSPIDRQSRAPGHYHRHHCVAPDVWHASGRYRAVIPDLTVPDLVIPTLMVECCRRLPPGFPLPRQWRRLCRRSTRSFAGSATIIKDLYLNLRPEQRLMRSA
jgi:sodium/pantothenate symporter